MNLERLQTIDVSHINNNNDALPLRILVLGDGNFSFSSMLLYKYFYVTRKKRPSDKRHIIHNRPLTLVSTVYDSINIQHTKYRNSIDYEYNIMLHGGYLAYSIDATNIQQSLCQYQHYNDILHNTIDYIRINTQGGDHHKQLLCDMLINNFNRIYKYKNSTNESDNNTNDYSYEFDIIIFNHPHSGEENLIRHNSLLHHFLRSVKDICNKEQCYVIITLCNLQPQQWNIDYIIQYHGYVIDDYRLFDPKQYSQWEQKRHHNNTQFTYHQNYTDKDNVDGKYSNLQHCYWLRYEHNNNSNNTIQCQINKEQHNSNPLYCCICDTTFDNIEHYDAHYNELQPVAYSSQTEYQCATCDKVFSNERAYKQHITYTNHDTKKQPDHTDYKLTNIDTS